MPTTKTYRGDSIPVAKVVNISPIGPIVAGQSFAVWCNGKQALYVAQPGDSIPSVVAGLAAAIATIAGTAPEFTEFTTAANGNTLVLTAATPGVPFEVTCTCSGNLTVVETTQGGGVINEAWSIALIGNYTGGTFTLTVNVGGGNVTTAAIAYNAAAAAVQSALVALAGVGTGQVLVTGGPGPGSPWFVTWTGSLGGTSIAPGTVNGTSLTGGATVTIAEQQAGNGLSDNIQVLDMTPTLNGSSSDVFNLSFNGQQTSQLTAVSTAAQIQTALQALPNIGSNNVLVYSPTGGNAQQIHYIHFTAGLAAQAVSTLAVVNFVSPFGTHQAPVVTPLQQGGQTSSDDFQYILLDNTALGGTTFSVSYGGQTTYGISNAYSAGYNPAAALQTALQNLSTIGSGNCYVYPPVAGSTYAITTIRGFLVRLTGTKANTIGQNYVPINAGFTPTSTRISNGQANRNEIQTIAVSATGGTFTLTAGAQTTSAIAWNASTGTLQTRIQTDLSTTWVAVTVTGSGTNASPWVVTATNPANMAIALLTANAGSLTGGAGTITELTAGHAGTNEVQTVTLASGVNAGTFTLAFNGSPPTEALAWNSTGAQVQAALLALSTINTVTVAGSAGGPWTVTWSGNQAGLPQPLLVADGSQLTGMLVPPVTLSTAVFSAGPLHYDDPTNWLPAGVPGTLDVLSFSQGSTDCLYGFQQIATCQVDSSIQTVVVSATGGTFTLTESAQTTAAIAYNASASAVRAAILAAFTSTVSACTVTGAGTAASPWVITMLGVNGLSQPFMTANAGSLTGGAGTVTINASTFVWTSKSSLQNGQAVSLTTTNALPTGLTAASTYYLANVNRDALTFQLATTVGGAPVSVTTLGTGTHTIGARLANIEASARWSGQLGLPRENALGYVEYRSRYLHVGLATVAQGGTLAVTFGTDSGSGSGKIQIDNDVDQAIWKVLQSGSSFDVDARDVMLKGTHASNTLEVIAGDVGVAFYEGETTNLASVKVRAGTLELGPGVTVTGPVEVTGGKLISDGATINGTLAM